MEPLFSKLIGHGTFVKGVRVTSLQPIFLELNDDFHFGASTRRYIIRSKLEVSANNSSGSKDDINLPEKEYELDVCQYNFKEPVINLQF